MLPTDLVIKILLRTDTPTIGRCRCVSNEWNQILTSEAFLSKHHNLCSTLQSSFLFHVWFSQWHGSPNAFFRICSNTGQPLYFPLLPHLRNCVDVNIIGNQKGNLCISYKDEDKKVKILIWNVLTSQKRLVPGPPNDGFQVLLCTLSFTYVPGTVHYYIIHTYRSRLDNEFLIYQLYSSEDHKWSRTKGCAGDIYKLGPGSIALNGEVYWINYSATANNIPESIISYLVVSRRWNVLNLPPNYHSVCHSLLEHQGRVALLYLPAHTNDHTMSIVSLRENLNGTLSWRVVVKIPGLQPHDMPRFLDHQDIISLIEAGEQGMPGMEGIILSRVVTDFSRFLPKISFLAKISNNFSLSSGNCFTLSWLCSELPDTD
ncbi:hypothetical protein PIB30_042229 [Stylosanthes scabra]|uniref:F-box domain-containing protein n=1 Tax=Stylosanthes scabra TaxID=79078 RepID=A0ABU6XCV9_9FABA|nr:hypothetical protein [Stylosanthes scabra]